MIQLVLAIIGSSALFTFIQYLITRYDNQHAKLNDISGKIDALQDNTAKEFQEVHNTVSDLNRRIDKTAAITARVRILRASDEIRSKVKHSQEWFDQLNEDVDSYEQYCRDNPTFKNNKAVHAIANINNAYAKALKENDFL